MTWSCCIPIKHRYGVSLHSRTHVKGAAGAAHHRQQYLMELGKDLLLLDSRWGIPELTLLHIDLIDLWLDLLWPLRVVAINIVFNLAMNALQ